MIYFGLGKFRLWSAAAVCVGLFMTQGSGTPSSCLYTR